MQIGSSKGGGYGDKLLILTIKERKRKGKENGLDKCLVAFEQTIQIELERERKAQTSEFKFWFLVKSWCCQVQCNAQWGECRWNKLHSAELSVRKREIGGKGKQWNIMDMDERGQLFIWDRPVEGRQKNERVSERLSYRKGERERESGCLI